ncbi:MAG TPA: hypothetical protein VFY06_01440 [Verrucomicrobiae bacterium]|nr:hypothetical protein [Verrucomicrobiae bacterium]
MLLQEFVPDVLRGCGFGERHLGIEEILVCPVADGTVAAWGEFGIFGSEGQAFVSAGSSNVVAIGAGPDYFPAITANMTVAERFRQKSN